NVQARLSFCTYFLLYPLVITLQDWSVNHVRNLKCQPCMEAAHVDINTGRQIWKFPMMNMVDSSAAIASNMMLIGSRDGLLYTFGSLHLI
ncbi:MAG: hypothetical protein WAM42_20170, partial [Candidatus Nitrosopolaris sp.]